ncbi:ferric iron reductase protein FhuF [Pseudomonas fluvialis]|uniref:Ferric iron reductase protein FhuF n=1 Tax=Pseudomonas fluvialis TaxID=1793966 RepID=A0A7X0ESK1_9PSED|nr:siderophore-iron reductase FhuF [Pseudomonas fluvialis]MBB6342363.1 ferric iron reductase protein FhuF [Pseudomonas fluvialis]
MIPALAPLFQGPFAQYREVLTLLDDPRPALSGREFVSPERLEQQMLRFAPEHAEGDRRALLSLWSKYYFLRLIPPVLAAGLILNWRLPLDFDEIQVVVGADGLPEAFKLPHGGERWNCPPQDGFERFGDLLDANLLPFIEGLRAHRKIAARVLWSNAGNYFEWFMATLGGLPFPKPMLAPGLQVLEARLRPDGARNPLFDPIRYVPQGEGCAPWRQRRQCCIRNELGMTMCDNCSLLDAPPVEASGAPD